MAVNHRKLVIESIRQETIEYCKPFCDPLQNPKGLCPISCFSVCISRCYNQIVDLIPPPPEILPPADPPHHHRKLSLSLTIFISILAVTFFLFFCFTIYKCKAWYRGRSRRSTNLQPQLQQTNEEFFDEDHGFVMDHPIWYIRTIGLQPSVISAISIYEYKAGEGLVEGTECSVCLNEFQEHETLRLLPKCNHAFHIPCIDTWLRSHTNCPLCRAGIISNVAGNLPALPPPPEQIIDTSNVLDNTQMGTSVNNSENGSESEEEEGESREENEIKRNEIDKEIGDVDQLEENEVQPMRRSFSVDFSLISSAEFDAKFVQSDTKNSASRMVKADELNRGSSSGRSLQKGPVLMKRSVSYSGKVLFSNNSNSHSHSHSKN